MRILTLIFIISLYNSYSQTASNERKPQNYKSSIMLNGHIGTNTRAVGCKYIGSIILKKYPKYALGFNLESEKVWYTDNLTLPNNTETDIKFGIVGMHLRYQINEQLFFQPEVSILFGKQEITTLVATPTSYGPFGTVLSYKYNEVKKEQNILGANLEQHLFFYPKKAKGLVIGLSVFERLLNAEYYDGDFGLCGYLGINF